MKIFVEDGIVVCSQEDTDEILLDVARGCFDGFYKGKLKLAVSAGEAMSSRELVEREIHLISSLIRLQYAWHRELSTDIDRSVFERLEALRTALNKLTEPERLELQRQTEEQEHIKLWQEKCEKGCGKCPYRKRGFEDNYCKASGDLLEEKNVPGYVNGVHYLFKYEPFPNGNCVYKIN